MIDDFPTSHSQKQHLAINTQPIVTYFLSQRITFDKDHEIHPCPQSKYCEDVKNLKINSFSVRQGMEHTASTIATDSNGHRLRHGFAEQYQSKTESVNGKHGRRRPPRFVSSPTQFAMFAGSRGRICRMARLIIGLLNAGTQCGVVTPIGAAQGMPGR